MNSHLTDYNLDIKLTDEMAAIYVLFSLIGVDVSRFNLNDNNNKFLKSMPRRILILAKSVRDFLKTQGFEPYTCNDQFFDHQNRIQKYDPKVYESK